MFGALMLFALAASSTTPTRPCPPAGFENVKYVSDQVAATLAAEMQHHLQLDGGEGWGGPAGMEGRPAEVNLDLYLQPDGEVAAICVVSGERHVVAAVARDLAPLKLAAPRERLIVPLNVKLIWRSSSLWGPFDGIISEFTAYQLKVSAAERDR